MKKTKIVLLGFLLILSVNAHAQDKPLIIGLKVGINLSSISGDISHTKTRFGYNVGVTLDYGFTEDWYLLTGLEYTTKGVNFKNIAGIKPSISAAYIQLPIHAGYKLNVSPSSKIGFHAGPYLACGTNGKKKLDGPTVEGVDKKGREQSTFEDDILKRFDFGLGLGVGAEFGKINVGIGYDFGLINVAKNDENDYYDVIYRNGNAYFSLGYKF